MADGVRGEQPISFFDAHCTVGRLAVPPPWAPRSPEGLLGAMDHAGVERALVCHSQSLEAHPAVGNERVVEVVAAWPRLAGCWVVLPPTTGEMPPPEQLVEAMGAAGVRAVRLCPSGGRHQFPLGSADAARLLTALDARRVPTLIDLGETSWGEVERIAKAHPHLPLIVLNTGYRVARTAYPVLEAAENVRLEISHYQGCGLLREGVERFGPGRFLFGTGLPQFEPGCAVATVLYAEIPHEAKRLVAGATLEALLQGAEL